MFISKLQNIWYVFLIFLSLTLAQSEAYENPETVEIVHLVKQATRYIEKKGEIAFNDFRKSNSKWNHGDTYIFVLDLNGKMVVHPDTSLVGKNQLSLTDINNKPFIKWFIYLATNSKGYGWSHYLWVKPGQVFPSWKSTYVKLVTSPMGNKYIVCCGKYNLPIEKQFIVETIDFAAEMIQRKGKKAFELFRNKNSEFIYMNTYIFVLDMKGKLLVHPAFPRLENSNLKKLTDFNGKVVADEIFKILKKQDSGWIEYLWPKPGSSEPSIKHTYIRKVSCWEGDFIIGDGFYEQ